MTNITTILANEAGIQYQGVEDKSSKTGTYPIIGMITGTFKRGRFDKPMTITPANIKAQLGYEPDNPHYMAVMDVLASGVPSVQVLRVKSDSLFCVNVPKYNYDVYNILNPAYEDRDYTPSEFEQFANQVISSLKVTINGQTYTRSDNQRIGIMYRPEYGELQLSVNTDITGDYNSMVVCASLPIKVRPTPM